MYRTHTCWELTAEQAWKQVTLCWRVNKVRNLWGMTFIDLRDRYGITQVTVDPAKTKISLPEIKSEYVLQITGAVIARPKEMINKEMNTWDAEIYPSEIKVLSVCKELPFSVDHENPVGEDIRLEYRYLDLRRQGLKNTILMRHKLYIETMKFFDAKDFLHLETPTFIKNTPEWSREFVVPARFEPGKFFVLPQSPQQHKQMLMVAGFDKYFQLARCYRDEDPRGDRQPEFTQVDFEMSFVEQEDILKIIHDYFVHITKTLYPNKTIKADPFPVLTRDEAMNSYGSDKPELRTTELKIQDATQRAKTTDFKVFQEASNTKLICVPKLFSRSEVDAYDDYLKQYGSKGLAWLSITKEWVKWSIAKFVSEEALSKLPKMDGEYTLFFQSGIWEDVVAHLWMLRNKLIADLKLIEGKENELSFAFVVDFPLFELGDDGKLCAVHHPFTKPKDEDIPFVKELGQKAASWKVLSDDEMQKLLSIKADCYDIIINGNEAGGWSIRIYDTQLQSAIFSLLGLNEKQIQERFGHLLKCFEYGVPPHGGCAFGFDRIVMIYQNVENIREVIIFPKNQKYRDLMLNAPSEIDEELLTELGLKIIKKK